MIRTGLVWLTLADAATRVGRSERTIRRWITTGRLRAYLGRVDEHALLLADRDARLARNTARGASLQVKPRMCSHDVTVGDARPGEIPSETAQR